MRKNEKRFQEQKQIENIIKDEFWQVEPSNSRYISIDSEHYNKLVESAAHKICKFFKNKIDKDLNKLFAENDVTVTEKDK
jgi:hypothetical protein